MNTPREGQSLSQNSLDPSQPWKIKPRQLILLIFLVLVIAGQIIWAIRSVASYAVEREQIVSQETDIAALTFTQRDSFTLLQRFDRWSLGEASARDVLIARANLAQRLSVISGSGQNAFASTHKDYQDALGDLDKILLELSDLPESQRNDFRVENLEILNRFEIETRQLSATFQNLLVNQLRESLRQRVVAEVIYVALLSISILLFIGVVIWLGTDIVRTYRKNSDKLKMETELLEINRNRLLFIINLEKLSAQLANKIESNHKTEEINKLILDFMKELLPNDLVTLESEVGDIGPQVIAGEDSVIEEDRQRVVDRAQELLRMLKSRDKAEEALNYQADHDLLTGLSNRRHFSARLNELVESQNSQNKLLIMVLDLDRFSAINNALGFVVGDQLLKEVAARLSGNVMECDLVARISSDEFAIITSAEDFEEAKTKANFVNGLMHFNTFLGEINSPVTASIGAVWLGNTNISATEIIGQLSVALQVARESQNESLVFFDPELHNKLASSWLDDLELHKSFRQGDFVLYYQPVVELNSNHITGFEALLRWNKPGHGLLYPNEFLESLDRAGLILDLGRQILEQALLTWKRTLTKLPATSNPFVSINIDAKQLSDPSFSSFLIVLAKRLGVANDCIVIEVTERDLTEGALAQNHLKALRTAGIKIALDDFGTGYSNFSQLRDLPVDIIKLDKSFSESLTEASPNIGLISDMVKMANRLNLKVVAEGIESEDSKDKLKEVGITYGQGYLFAQALPETELVNWSIEYNGVF
jgi:diguanylate cyclase (GGDEF)-like protein